MKMIIHSRERRLLALFNRNRIYSTCSNNISNQDNVVGIVTRLWTEWPRVHSPARARDFCSPKCPDCVWGPPSLQCGGYQGFFLQGCGLSCPSSVMVKNEWSCSSALLIRHHDVRRYSSAFTVIMLIHIVFIFRETFRVVGFEVETTSIDYSQLTFSNDDTCSFPDKPKPQLVNEQSATRLFFTYSVDWRKSEVSWASRWDIYLGMSDVQIHWFSIINSLVVVFFLSGKNGPYNGIWFLSVCLSVCTLVLKWLRTFFFFCFMCV